MISFRIGIFALCSLMLFCHCGKNGNQSIEKIEVMIYPPKGCSDNLRAKDNPILPIHHYFITSDSILDRIVDALESLEVNEEGCYGVQKMVVKLIQSENDFKTTIVNEMGYVSYLGECYYPNRRLLYLLLSGLDCGEWGIVLPVFEKEEYEYFKQLLELKSVIQPGLIKDSLLTEEFKLLQCDSSIKDSLLMILKFMKGDGFGICDR